jgi:hypothetical protein
LLYKLFNAGKWMIPGGEKRKVQKLSRNKFRHVFASWFVGWQFLIRSNSEARQFLGLVREHGDLSEFERDFVEAVGITQGS